MNGELKRISAAEMCEKVFDVKFFKALCEPVRIDLIKRLILLGRADVATIAKGMQQDRSVVSRHLSLLQDAGIVCSEKEGRHVYFDLNGGEILERLEQLLETARSLQNVCCPESKSSLLAKKVNYEK